MKLKSLVVLAALTLTGCAHIEGTSTYSLADVGKIFTVGNIIGYTKNANANQVRYSSNHEEAMALKRAHDAQMDAEIAAEQARSKARNIDMTPERRQCEINWKMNEIVLMDKLSKASLENYEARYNALNKHRLLAHSKVQKCLNKSK